MPCQRMRVYHKLISWTVLLPKKAMPQVADLCYTVSTQEITMDAAENQIVVYQPNETVRLDVR